MDPVVETRFFPRAHDIFRRHNGIGALDANGISGIIIGVIAVLIAFAGLVGGIKCWKKRVQQRQTGEDVEMGVAHSRDLSELDSPSSASPGTPNNNTVVIMLNNFYFYPSQVTAPVPAQVPSRGAIEEEDFGQSCRGESVAKLGDLMVPVRAKTWPWHKGHGE